MFIEQEPQIPSDRRVKGAKKCISSLPSRQERRNVRVGSTSFLILKSASRTMGPHSWRLRVKSCMCGFTFGELGFCSSTSASPDNVETHPTVNGKCLQPRARTLQTHLTRPVSDTQVMGKREPFQSLTDMGRVTGNIALCSGLRLIHRKSRGQNGCPHRIACEQHLCRGRRSFAGLWTVLFCSAQARARDQQGKHTDHDCLPVQTFQFLSALVPRNFP